MRIFTATAAVIAALATSFSYSQETVQVNVDITANRKPISPYIYGRNNSLSDNQSQPLSEASWEKLQEAGVKFFREGGGNNSTKYNWRLKLSSHPDWYNNVYSHNWDYAARSLQENIPEAQGMWTFQLLGKVAGSKDHNFGDWAYNQSKWWSGVSQNLAGGGEPDESGGSKALVEGDTELYLVDWPADSTVAILDHWFSADGLALDSTTIRYWNMDNEPEIWNGTHDDVMPVQESAEAFMQRYFSVAKAARAKFPGIKLVGPVPANEWQWYNWNNNAVSYGGKNLSWLEFFIRRIAEEQAASGIRLLDVLDIHFYPGSTTPAQLVQYHRVFFDKTYVYPEANGVKRVTGGWDNSITKEYIFERCREWLNKYVGADHGVTFSISETDIQLDDPDVTAVWYASMLGEFMKHDMEIFTPWSWRKGMWEVLHLYSRYNKSISVSGISSDETYVSAYPSVSPDADSLTLLLVNRSLTDTRSAQVSFSYFRPDPGVFTSYSLSNLPNTETFVSHTQNALVMGETGSTNNLLTVSLPPLSITSVILTGEQVETSVVERLSEDISSMEVYPNPVADAADVSFNLGRPGRVTVDLLDMAGRTVDRLADGDMTAGLHSVQLINNDSGKGFYLVRLNCNGANYYRKVLFR